MINQNIQTQNLQSTNLIFAENQYKQTDLNLDLYVSKVTSLNKQQIKSYLGIFYFVVVSLLSATLFI